MFDFYMDRNPKWWSTGHDWLAMPPSGGQDFPGFQRTVLDRMWANADVHIMSVEYVEPETIENKDDFLNNFEFLVEAGEDDSRNGSDN